jgi:lysophospholipase L1-like esterase
MLTITGAPLGAWAADGDGDGIDDARDNCTGCWNPEQDDTDHDGFGDCWRCDVCNGPGDDQDWDGVCSLVDNCPEGWNASQRDGDSDGVGNYCDLCLDVPGEPWTDGCPDTDQEPDTGDDTGSVVDTTPTDTGSAVDTGSADTGPSDTGSATPTASATEDTAGTEAEPDPTVETDPYILANCTPMPAVVSPMTTAVVDNLVDIMADGINLRPNVFMVVGDSISDAGGLLSYYLGNCAYPYGVLEQTYGWVDIKDLRCYPDLTNGLDYFLTGRIGTGTVTSFTRDSLSARASRTATWALAGSSSPVQQEINALHPQYALIMFGSNDTYGIPAVGGEAQIATVANTILAIVDTLIDQGIIPILISSPTKPRYDAQLAYLADLLETAAAAYKIPYVDFYAASWPLPNHGQGTDGTHPCPYDYNRTCVFTREALNYGANMHNLVTLKVLDDLYEALR